jgi:hypothetical protein
MSVRSFRLAFGGLLVLAAPAAVAPAVAGAASLRLDKACYVSEGTTRERAFVTASGFTPGAPLNVTANGQAFGSGTVQADGTLKGPLRVPSIGGNEAKFIVRATDGVHKASASFTATRLHVDLFPRSGRARSWRARFSAYGLAAAQRLLSQPVKRTVYAHWLHNGTVRGTKRIGTLSGACGKVVSAKQKTFPYGIDSGIWRIQFDTNRTYKKSDSAYVRLVLQITRTFL